ncbi:MAG: hypothetical protein KGO49_00985 [Gammaproteobacteria bacterium]|nr:hypothetical protein [Gammaproteobacteria bacterium]
MRKIFLAPTILLLLISSESWSQEYTEQIHFKKGASSATYKGYLVKGDSTFYYFKANKDQYISTRLKSLDDNASMSYFENGLHGAGISIGNGTEYSETIQNSGEHMIDVSCDKGESCEYKLYVTIQ